MSVTVVSHAGIANRIKNLLSAMSQHEKVTTLHDTMTFLFPSIEKVDEVDKAYKEDWRLYVEPEEEKLIPTYKTIDLQYENTPYYFINKYLDLIHTLEINSEITQYVDEFTKDWKNMVGVHIRSW